MSAEALAAVWRYSQSAGTERLVMLAIANYADGNGLTSHVGSMRELAQCCRVTTRAVQYAIAKLIESGELVRTVNADGVTESRDDRHNLFDIHVGCSELHPAMGCRVKPVSPSGKTTGISSVSGGGCSRLQGANGSVRTVLSTPDLLLEQTGSEQDVATSTNALTADDARDIWNAHKSAAQPKVTAMHGRRLQCTRARLREVRAYLIAESIDERTFWTSLVQRLAESPWHNGKNDRGWIADFDFAFNARTWIRFLERTLGDASKQPKQNAEQTRQQIRNANAQHVAKLPVYTPTWEDDEMGDAK